MRRLSIRILPACAVAAVAASPVQSGLAQDVGDCLASEWPQRELSCLRDAALELGDPEICLSSGDPAVRWQCVAGYADAARREAACEVLVEDSLEPAGIARELCRTHLAVAWREARLCEGLSTPGLGDSCLLKLVEEGGDAALCGRIANESLRAACGGD